MSAMGFWLAQMKPRSKMSDWILQNYQKYVCNKKGNVMQRFLNQNQIIYPWSWME